MFLVQNWFPTAAVCCRTRNMFFSKFRSYQEVIYLYKVISTLLQASGWPIMITSSDKFDSTTDRLISFSYDYRCDWHLLLHQVMLSCLLVFYLWWTHVSALSTNLYKTYRRQKFWGIYPTAVLSRGMESTTHIGPEKKKRLERTSYSSDCSE